MRNYLRGRLFIKLLVQCLYLKIWKWWSIIEISISSSLHLCCMHEDTNLLYSWRYQQLLGYAWSTTSGYLPSPSLLLSIYGHFHTQRIRITQLICRLIQHLRFPPKIKKVSYLCAKLMIFFVFFPGGKILIDPNVIFTMKQLIVDSSLQGLNLFSNRINLLNTIH